jgi:FixJ family two-component response regulator
VNEQETVFLVDDEPAVVKALSRLLRAEGYRTETFCSGREFMDRCKRGGSGCLVLDLAMPGINGLDVHEWLVGSGNPLPTIFLTAHDDLPEWLQIRRNQTACVLMKPVSARVLLRAIDEAMGRRREPRA